MQRLTILTAPIMNEKYFSLRFFRRSVGSIARYFSSKASAPISPYGGHPAVTRSLIHGLETLKANFNYNPGKIRDVGDVCHVLSDIEALKQAIEWKKRGRVKRLLAGPNLVVHADEFNGILSSSEIDVCLVPSEWVKIAYQEDVSALQGKIKIWFAGTDIEYWKPLEENIVKDRALVYWKSGDESFCEQAENILRAHGWDPIRIVYGAYNSNEYKNALSKSSFTVFLSNSESQGLALAESWAMNIPTFVWQPSELVISGRPYSSFSSSPYLNLSVGNKWTAMKELEDLVAQMKTGDIAYEPRKWVIKNMTDVISAATLLKIAVDSSEICKGHK